ncbi:hypothetical protein [Amycolatopsis lurida]|uniref:hypothetical protein n=2 Tax=Amycolatopsis TaxID=1813 RepID=UPI0036486E3A
MQEELWAALDHRDVSAVHLRRELARASGDPEVVMPAVFTSALGFRLGRYWPDGAPSGSWDGGASR